MPNLKEVRTRIKSVSSTQQITKAMKVVSAAKLRKAQDAIIQIRPYSNKLSQILSNLSSNLDDEIISAYSSEREIKKVLIVVITSNRGLCGGFNASVIKNVIKKIDGDYKGKIVDLICIGKKGTDFFIKRTNKILTSNSELFNNILFEPVAEIASEMMNKFLLGTYDRIEIAHNQFKNAGVQTVVSEQFLPIPKSISSQKNKKISDYIFEPSKEFIVRELIPKSLKTQLYRAILDSNAGEHGARMTAMDKATENASELLKDLKLTYNKARQAAITKEILEIVSGAEALAG